MNNDHEPAKEDIVNAFEESFASLRMEGLEPDAFTKDQVRRIAAGELSIADAINEVRAQYT